ncbi:DapH/DapD/GlmU-related protein [Aquihabitans sp. McL0605]|uniref:acyltransferase n=1 Tax=Aquihabitans sp. McL0605 TaxID=3415671 RepID=UPI003CEB8A18
MLPRPLAVRVHRVTNELIQRGWARLRISGAIAPGTAAAERFGAFGKGSIMGFPTAVLYGERHIYVGTGTTINTWVTLAAGYHPTQEGLPDKVISIGDHSVIGMRSGIVAHESITIGDDVWFGQEIYVTDANHGYSDPRTPPGKQLGAHTPVVIGDGCWIGHGTVILAGTNLGKHVVVAASSVVRGTFPDHSVIGGVPAKVIREHVPGVGWRRPDGTGDIIAESDTIDPEALAADLARLAEMSDEEIAAEIEAAAAHRPPAAPAPAPAPESSRPAS